MKNCILFLAFFASCTHEDALIPSVTKENDDADALALTFSGNSFLPVNLTEYDHALGVRTKSADGSGSNSYKFQFNQDSLLDSNGVRQKYFEQSGWLYTEFPFKSNGSFYAAITPDKSSVIDSLVTLKCSYMLVEHPSAPVEWMEYLVTMIPAKDYYLKNPDYTFLEMPSFSGVILYSDLEGNFLRSENYDRGVITFTTLKKNTTISTKSSGSVIDGGNLNEVYVTGVNLKELNDFYGRLEDYMNNLFSELQQVTDFVEKDDVGGGGGSRNKDKYCTVTEIQNLCLEKERTTTTHSVLKGNSISLMAKESADSLCLFMGWFSGSSEGRSRDERLTLTNIQNDITVSAKYTSPTHNANCYELMQILSADGRLRILDTLMKEFSFSREVLAKFSDGKIDLVRGKYKKVEFYFEEGTLYDGFAHSHEKDDCFLSGEDLGVFVANFLRYKDLSKAYCDILSWDEENHQYRMLMLNITNIKTFLNQIKNIEMFHKKYHYDFVENIKIYFMQNFKGYFRDAKTLAKRYLLLEDYLKQYGISYRLITINGDKNVINWGNYDPVYGENVPNSQWHDNNANIYDCFYRMF